MVAAMSPTEEERISKFEANAEEEPLHLVSALRTEQGEQKVKVARSCWLKSSGIGRDIGHLTHFSPPGQFRASVAVLHMAVRQAPTSVVQNVISALVEDPADLRRTAAAASAAAVLPGPEASDAIDAVDASVHAPAAAQLDADELLKQAEEQAGDQVRLFEQNTEARRHGFPKMIVARDAHDLM